MKSIKLVIGTFLATSAVLAATPLTNPDGTVFSFGDWSPPLVITLNSSQDPHPVVRRSVKVTKQDPRHNETYQFDLLLDPATQDVWAGPAYQRYFILGGSIYGIAVSADQLLVRRSEKSDAAADSSIDAITERALAEFFRNPHAHVSVEGATYTIDLSYVFGRNTLRPRRGGAQTSANPVSILEDRVDAESVTVFMMNIVGNKLELTLDSAFQPISAANNGKSVLILHDGKLPFEAPLWSPPKEFFVDSPLGEIVGQSSTREDKHSVDDSGRRRIVSIRAVVLPTGELWIGPSECWLACIDQRVVGLMTPFEDGSKLLVYAGPRAKLPIGAETRAAFRKELAKFEAELTSGQFKEDMRIDLPEIFKNDRTIVQDPDIAVKGISFDKSTLVVTLRTNDAHKDLELKLTPELRVGASRSKPSQPGRLPPALREVPNR